MATFNKFEIFTENLCEKVHNLDTDTLACYLTAGPPSASLDAVKADLAEITIQNGYLGFDNAQMDTQNSTSRSGGTTSVIGVDITINATGAVGPFEYVVLGNTTPVAPLDPLIGWWPYTSSISLANGESFVIDFGTEMFTVA
jgi:hypothetical protein